MTIDDLTKKEFRNMVTEYIKIRSSLFGLVSFEEFLDGLVRRCENCGELCIMDDFDEELPYADGKHICEDCEKESKPIYVHPEEDIMIRWRECE